ncbi:MAG: hypothetical protein JWN86_2012 [Planctomycetota bacterium]|nr:hypothetical protein [Planctomycetota bacterium]
MPVRRQLAYKSLDDVMPDVDRLLQGHETVKNWSLGQICNHLATSMRLTVEGTPIRAFKFWLIRHTVGRLARRHVFKTRGMGENFSVPNPILDPKPGLDARAEAEALRSTIRLFLAAEGPFRIHPAFGEMSVEEWRQFHAIHCAHHLSFAVPTGPSS